jgi:hypothetical protein
MTSRSSLVAAGLLSVCAVLAHAQDETREPPTTYRLEIDGQRSITSSRARASS